MSCIQACVKKEVNVLSALRHPSIIKVLGYSLDRVADPDLMQVCLVSEFAPQGGLDDHLRDDHKAALLSWDDRIRLLTDAAAAVHCLHTHNPPMYHRDIKSANFALTSDLKPKLIDCGLAKYLPQETDPLRSLMPTRSGQRPGTPAYSCPRYMSRGAYDFKSEVFSFGILIAEVLTGRLQGEGGDVFHQEVRVVEGLVQDPRAGAWPDACVGILAELALACMADYGVRVASMGEVLQRLENAVTAYCSPVSVARAAQNRAQLTELHQNRLRNHYEAQQERATDLARLECASCGERYDALEVMMCAAGHAQCAECFNGSLMSQTGMDSFQAFAAVEGHLVCQYCRPSTPYSAEMEHRGLSLANQASHQSYLRARVEFAVQTERRRLNAEIDQLRRQVAQGGMQRFFSCGACVRHLRFFTITVDV